MPFPRDASDAASAVRIPPTMTDKVGKVQIWSKREKRYIKEWPIDAKEKIHTGEFSLFRPGDEPEVETDRTQQSETVPPAPAKPADTSGSARESTLYPFSAHTLNELRLFARDAGVEHTDATKKSALVELLERANYLPPQARK